MKEAFDRKKCLTFKFDREITLVMKTTLKCTVKPMITKPKYRDPLIVAGVLHHNCYHVTQLDANKRSLLSNNSLRESGKTRIHGDSISIPMTIMQVVTSSMTRSSHKNSCKRKD
ncbi:hypothetical protein TNIN_87541 [Trichonephila inaurata madagascariensis]|uniref:Uncharacterized protein n=1 Tax=Trichonephila inaurata madagascariensis TaxID=2747483 RepID=A0A8X6YFR1_9ARAC|nr:hypothetical protein TNIN_87541 [Trichonephila inaurata madagascariensis]